MGGFRSSAIRKAKGKTWGATMLTNSREVIAFVLFQNLGKWRTPLLLNPQTKRQGYEG